mmetsp:Transcript_28495/g.62399  ORF Transcript_28495/g.62399 Transcript_28495/m.62399 type:complete len:467 (-) Transcript_28495:100-1500(-)|eukprot:CAMPEP_0118937864 /NCGR_PEP_ID=MMETSP1169-20130426/23979_1 /TAXON_ID=36882 /ORGANISM="Pyramimonas obovata, Strain CCMP722" /LENGTH=466 /DNA_ID=CAMNT_0006881621 /DNA_START=336 /DNA_END=1736 /DNA_ORIENTATION=+
MRGDLRGDRRRDETWQQKRLRDEIWAAVTTLSTGVETARARAAARLEELVKHRKLQLGLPLRTMIIDAGGVPALVRLLEGHSVEGKEVREAAAGALLALSGDVDIHCFLLRMGMLEALLRVASADTTDTLSVQLREQCLRMVLGLAVANKGVQATLMRAEGVVSMLMNFISKGSPGEKKWATEVVEILMGNQEYLHAILEGPYEAMSTIASLLLNPTGDASVMDCAGRMLCVVYEDQTTCHAQSPTGHTFPHIQVPAGGIPYFEHSPEEDQAEGIPPGLEALLCVLEANQCSAEVKERTLALLVSLCDQRSSARKANMMLWMLVRKVVQTARCVRALNHLLNAEVGTKCREIVAELLLYLSDKGASRIIMCKNSSIDALDRCMDVEHDSYLATLVAGALFNLSLDKTVYTCMSSDQKAKMKAIRDEQTLRGTRRPRTQLTAHTPVQVEWTPPTSKTDGMELSVVLP